MYELTEDDKKNLIDIKMTSNTTPAPYVASASSEYSSIHYPAWKAFNGASNGMTNCWVAANNSTSGWIQLKFGEFVNIKKIILVSRDWDQPITSIVDFDIESSVDGITFKKEKEVRGEPEWGIVEYRAFNVRINNAKFIRINIKKTQKIYPTLSQILFIERKSQKKILLRHTKTGKIYTIKEGSFS